MKTTNESMEIIREKLRDSNISDKVTFFNRIQLFTWQLFNKGKIEILSEGLNRGMSWCSAYITAKDFDVHEFYNQRPRHRYFVLEEPFNEELFQDYLNWCMIGVIFEYNFNEISYSDWESGVHYFEAEMGNEELATHETRVAFTEMSDEIPDEVMDYATQDISQDVSHYIPRRTNDVYYDSRDACNSNSPNTLPYSISRDGSDPFADYVANCTHFVGFVETTGESNDID